MKLVYLKIICTVLVVVLLITSGAVIARAASNAIIVTSAITGDLLYAGNDLQEAFAKSERGSIVSLSRYVTLSESVVLDVEIMLSGYSYLRGLSKTVQILLAGDGAIFVDTRIRTAYISARNAYSTVECSEESEGYVYYLVTQAPSLEEKIPVIDISANAYGAKIDEEAGIIYIDGPAKGLKTADFAKMITIDADNADGVEPSFLDTVEIDGEAFLKTGSQIILTATNYDYDYKISKTYTLILLGDVNGNGRIDASDAALMLRHKNGTEVLEGYALAAADADMDGYVTASDAEQICFKYVRASSYESAL